MTQTTNDGGPAFPQPVQTDLIGAEGMTLRDFHAAAALPLAMEETGLASKTSMANQGYDTWEAAAAAMAYRFADAMLAARDALDGDTANV